MTEHDESGTAPRPVPDLGFFTGAPQQGGGPFGGAPADPFGAPAPTFGPSPFGGPSMGTPQPPPAGRTGLAASTRVGIGVAAVVVLLVAVLGGRFAWQQLLADPVVPETLGGMPRLVSADVDAVLANVQDVVGDELSADAELAGALYSDGGSTAYVLLSLRGGANGSTGEDGTPPGFTESSHDGATCMSGPAADGSGVGMTMCVQGLWRRAVVLVAVAPTAPSPSAVAGLTHEAWGAQ